MSFSLEQINYLAKLARLEVTPEESRRLQNELSSIVGYVEGLQKVNVDNIVPMTHPVSMHLQERDDVIDDQNKISLLSGSLGYKDGFVRVPKIIE